MKRCSSWITQSIICSLFLFPSLICIPDNDIYDLLSQLPEFREYQENFVRQMLYNAQKEQQRHEVLYRYKTATESGMPLEPSQPDKPHDLPVPAPNYFASPYPQMIPDGSFPPAPCPQPHDTQERPQQPSHHEPPSYFPHNDLTCTTKPQDICHDARRQQMRQQHEREYRMYQMIEYQKIQYMKQHYSPRAFVNHLVQADLRPGVVVQRGVDLAKHADTFLNHYELYEIAAYQQLLRDVPGYYDHIEKLHQEIQSSHSKLSSIKPHWMSLSDFKKLIQDIHDDLQKNPTAEHKQRLEQQKADYVQSLVNQHRQDHDAAQDMLQEYAADGGDDPDDPRNNRHQSRRNALADSYAGQDAHITTTAYTLSPEQQDCIRRHNLDYQDYAQCIGSPIQQTLHQELLEVLHQTDTFASSDNQEAVNWAQVIALSTDAACAYNKGAHLTQAVAWTDSCWALLDYASAVAEGFFEGSVNAACFAIATAMAPQAVGAATGTAIALTAYTVVKKVCWVISDLCDAYDKSPKDFKQRIDEHIQNCTDYLRFLAKDLATHEKRRAVVKQAATLGTAVFPAVKALKASHSLGCAALKETKAFAKKIRSRGPYATISDFAYKNFDASPKPGYVNLAIFSKRKHRMEAQIAAQAMPEFRLSKQIIKRPWLQTALNKERYMLIKKNGLIMYEHPHVPFSKTDKLSVMPASLLAEIDAGYAARNGSFMITAATQAQLGTIQKIMFTKEKLMHVLALELSYKPKIGFFTSGFHYDPHGVLKNLNLMPLRNIRKDAISNIGRAEKLMSKGPSKPKTFFPNDWSVEHILENAQDALLNVIQTPTYSKDTYQLVGTTRNNIDIIFNIDMTGNLISFYPK